MKKLSFSLLLVVFAACNSTTVEQSKSENKSIDDITNEIASKESEFSEKQVKPGELVNSISFNTKTTDKEWENGLIPWVSLTDVESEMKNIIDKDEVVIKEEKVTVVIDYPLTNECRFDLESEKGFTREILLRRISEKYKEIYDEEERTATVKTIAMDKRKIMNRNETNGKYGIWRHDIADMVLSEILVFKSTSGNLILMLGIES